MPIQEVLHCRGIIGAFHGDIWLDGDGDDMRPVNNLRFGFHLQVTYHQAQRDDHQDNCRSACSRNSPAQQGERYCRVGRQDEKANCVDPAPSSRLNYERLKCLGVSQGIPELTRNGVTSQFKRDPNERRGKDSHQTKSSNQKNQQQTEQRGKKCDQCNWKNKKWISKPGGDMPVMDNREREPPARAVKENPAT